MVLRSWGEGWGCGVMGLPALGGREGDLTSKVLFSLLVGPAADDGLGQCWDPLSSLTTQLNHRLAHRQQFSKGDLLLRETEFTVRLPLKALEMSLTQLLARGSPQRVHKLAFVLCVCD